jgi:hypothetical protein
MYILKFVPIFMPQSKWIFTNSYQLNLILTFHFQYIMSQLVNVLFLLQSVNFVNHLEVSLVIKNAVLSKYEFDRLPVLNRVLDFFLNYC